MGFWEAADARAGAEAHFLRASEAWEELAGKPVLDGRAALEEARSEPDRIGVLARAGPPYESTGEAETLRPAAPPPSETVDRRDRRRETLAVATAGGIYAEFAWFVGATP